MGQLCAWKMCRSGNRVLRGRDYERLDRHNDFDFAYPSCLAATSVKNEAIFDTGDVHAWRMVSGGHHGLYILPLADRPSACIISIIRLVYVRAFKGTDPSCELRVYLPT